MARLQQVSEHSGLSYREILSQAIDVAWHVQMSGELDRRPEGAPAADVPATSEGQLAIPVPESLRRFPQIEHTIERIRTETSLTHDQLQDVLSRLHVEGLLRPDQSYHGWSNYETWNVHLWLTNDERTYHYCRRLARASIRDAENCRQVRERIWEPDEAPVFLLADALKEYVESQNPLADRASMFSDLLNAALSEANWHEIAEAFLEE